MARVIRRAFDEVTVAARRLLVGRGGAIPEATNNVGRRVLIEALKHFDTDGSPNRVSERELTAKRFGQIWVRRAAVNMLLQ